MVFFVLALLAIAGALGVVLSRTTVKSALSLLLVFLSVGCLYLTLNAEVLAAVQVLVYAGAVLVLFLFVIMLMAGGDEGPVTRWHVLGKVAGVGLAIAFLSISGGALLMGAWWPEMGGALQVPMGHVRTLAAILFTRYLLPFEVTSLLLLAAVIGAVVLAGKRNTDIPGGRR